MTVRVATLDDLTTVEDLVERAYAPWIERIGRRPGPMDDDYAALIAAREVELTQGGTGLIVLRPRPDHLLVDNVAVAPEHHGKGIGRALLDHAAARAVELDLPELRLYTHERMTENIELYRRLGWTETQRERQRGFARVFMRKPVA